MFFFVFTFKNRIKKKCFFSPVYFLFLSVPTPLDVAQCSSPGPKQGLNPHFRVI